MFKGLCNYLWRHNPATKIIYAQAPRGIKVIALSLLLVVLCAAPLMVVIVFDVVQPVPVSLAWLFAAGALVAHMGFFVGLFMLIMASYKSH